MYSGAEVFVMLAHPQPAPAENLCQLPLPGELLYFYDPGTGAVGAKKPVGELVIVYGRGVMLRAHEGVPTHCVLFGRIPGDIRLNRRNLSTCDRDVLNRADLPRRIDHAPSFNKEIVFGRRRKWSKRSGKRGRAACDEEELPSV